MLLLRLNSVKMNEPDTHLHTKMALSFFSAMALKIIYQTVSQMNNECHSSESTVMSTELCTGSSENLFVSEQQNKSENCVKIISLCVATTHAMLMS